MLGEEGHHRHAADHVLFGRPVEPAILAGPIRPRNTKTDDGPIHSDFTLTGGNQSGLSRPGAPGGGSWSASRNSTGLAVPPPSSPRRSRSRSRWPFVTASALSASIATTI